MLKSILFFTSFLLLTLSFGQFNGPNIGWRYHDIAPGVLNGTIVQPVSGSGVVPGATQTFASSGEDWWYDIENIIDGGEHVGYIVSGYATWNDIETHESNFGGCVELDKVVPNLATTDCSRPILDNKHFSPKQMTIARYDLKGNMIWCKAFANAEEGAIAITPVSGGYVFTGWGSSTRALNGSPIYFNPRPSAPTTDIPGIGGCSDLKRKMLVGKIDTDGNLLWLNQYSQFDSDDGFSTPELMRVESIGYDVVETALGNYRVVGRCEDMNDLHATEVDDGGYPVGYTKLFVIDLAPDGQIVSKKIFGEPQSYCSAREITRNGSNYYITGFQNIGSTGFGGSNNFDGVLFKIDESMNRMDFGAETWPVGGTDKAAVRFGGTDGHVIGWDVKVLTSGKIAWGFLEDCANCTMPGEFIKFGRVFIYDETGTDPTIFLNLNSLNTYGIESFRAFDMKLGLTATQDGGVAVISTYQVFKPNKLDQPYSDILTNLDGQITTYNCNDGFGNNTTETSLDFANSDAYIAKFDEFGNMLWDKSFDADPNPIENFPGDWKEQECVYRIVEADDGSLVFVGNTSHNADDYYIGKIESDCAYSKEINDEYDIHSQSQGNILNINSNTTWDFSLQGQSTYSVNGTVVVKSGYTLTVDGITLEFADSRKMPLPTKIVVEPGAQLHLINGAVLTSLSTCDNTMWDGVQVWGNKYATQNTTNQGRLFMNDATIENAIIGVACVKRDGFTKDLSKTGGILDIRNSTFRNNLIGIEMRPYSDNSSGTVVDNISFIRTTDFVIDGPLNDLELASTSQIVNPSNGLRETTPRAHQEFILLDGIRGLKIRGNNFRLDDTNPYIAAVDEKWRGYGILSWDSDFNLTSHKISINDPNPTPNTFDNLWIGVYCKPMGAVNDVVINDNVFNNNHYGVALAGAVNYAKITKNEFNVAESPAGVTLANANAAIYVQVATGLKIEDNDINGFSQSGVAVNAGIYIEHTSPSGGSAEIYRNNFDLLDVSIQTVKDNSLLHVDCNEFKKAPFENAIIWHNAGASTVPDQGQCILGDNEAPQANEFVGVYNFADYTILNEGAYFEYSRFSDPQFESSNNLGALDINCLISGPSTFLSCPVRNAPPDFPVVGIQIDELVNEIGVLEDIIDKADTEGLIEIINTTGSSNVIRKELLEVTPYLSDEVLITLINKPGVSPSVINQVLSENEVSSTGTLEALLNSSNNYPNWLIKNQILNSSPVDESILILALNRAPALGGSDYNAILNANSPLQDETILVALNMQNSLPNWVVRNVLSLNTPLSANVDATFQVNTYPNWVYNQVYSSGVVAEDPASKIPPTSARIELEKQIQYKKNLKARQVDYLVTYYLDDNNFEPAVLLLEAQNSIEGSCLLLPLLLETKDGTRLYQHILAIRADADKDPTSSRSESLYAFCDYYELMFNIREQPGGIEAITPTQIVKLQSLSSFDNGTAINSINVLQYLELKEIFELQMIDINFGGVQKAPVNSGSPEHDLLLENPAAIDFTLYPNPANTEVHIQYDINDLSTESTLSMYDLSGKFVYTTSIYDQHNEVILRVSDYDKGIYLVNITSEKGDVVTKKLIIQ